MKIVDLRTAVVEANFDWTYIRLYADDGTYGTGECFLGPAVSAVAREYRSIVAGEDPRRVEPLLAKLRRASSGAGLLAGVAIHALSGIEIALWDLLGKAYGLPVHQLLGGKFRDRIPIYTDCHAGTVLSSYTSLVERRTPRWMAGMDGPESEEEYSPEAFARHAKAVAARGFPVIKFDLDPPGEAAVGPMTRALRKDELDWIDAVIGAVCGAVGAQAQVAFDCHWRFMPPDALKIARRCEPHEVLWLEDPLPAENITAIAELKRATRTPIAGGEHYYLRHGFREVIEKQALSILTPDLHKAGGLLEGKKIADMGALFDMPVAVHNIASPLGTVAACHACAAMSNFIALEFHAAGVPFWDSLLTGAPSPLIQSGHISVPDAPGLGVELNEDVARQYAKDNEPFF
jgi:gluconate/galactonate dehydratase